MILLVPFVLASLGLFISSSFAFSCEEALKAIEPYDPSVKSCELVHGMPIIKYRTTRAIPGAINCSTIPQLLTSQGRSVQDCLTVNGSSFFRIDQLYDWQGAWVACHGVPGANLASVRNINEFIVTIHLAEAANNLASLYSWIGLNDIDQEGVYRWSHDSSVTTYKKFIADKPAGGTSQNCVAALRFTWHWAGHYMPNSGWTDFGCNEKLFALCKVTPV